MGKICLKLRDTYSFPKAQVIWTHLFIYHNDIMLKYDYISFFIIYSKVRNLAVEFDQIAYYHLKYDHDILLLLHMSC